MASDKTDPQTEALTAILVPTDKRASIQEAASETSAEVLAGLRAWVCDTPEDEAGLVEILHAIKGRGKEVESMRTSITGPLNAAKRAVDALFKPVLESLTEAEAIIKGKLAEAHERREATNQTALQAASASARAGDASAAAGALASVDRSKPSGVSFRCTWVFVVEDVDKVPRDWLTVDHSKVKIHLGKFNDTPLEPTPVPGLKFSKVTHVAAR